MDYGEILGRSWRITWNNKFLWVLGFLAALTNGGSSFSYSGGEQFPTDMQMPDLARLGATIIAIVCIALFVGLFLLLLSLTARNGLIYAADHLDEGLFVTLGDAFGAGWRSLGRTIGVALLLFLPLIVVAVIIVIAASAGVIAAVPGLDSGQFDPESSQFGLLIVCLALLFCCLAIVAVILSIVLNFVYAFAVRGVVLKSLGVVEAIRHGLQVLRNNLPETIILAVIFFFLNLALGVALLVIMLPLFLLVSVAALGGNLDMTGLNLATILPALAMFICFGLLAAALSSILVTWQSTAFTLAYREFTSHSPLPDL